MKDLWEIPFDVSKVSDGTVEGPLSSREIGAAIILAGDDMVPNGSTDAEVILNEINQGMADILWLMVTGRLELFRGPKGGTSMGPPKSKQFCERPGGSDYR